MLKYCSVTWRGTNRGRRVSPHQRTEKLRLVVKTARFSCGRALFWEVLGWWLVPSVLARSHNSQTRPAVVVHVCAAVRVLVYSAGIPSLFDQNDWAHSGGRRGGVKKRSRFLQPKDPVRNVCVLPVRPRARFTLSFASLVWACVRPNGMRSRFPYQFSSF